MVVPAVAIRDGSPAFAREGRGPLGGVDKLAVLGEQVTLGLVDRAISPVHLALRRRYGIPSMVIVVEQGSMDSERLALQDWAAPNRRQHGTCGLFANSFDQVFDQLHVAPVGEDRGELLIGGLEHAECSIRGAIDDLNVLHGMRSGTREGVTATDPRCRRVEGLTQGCLLEAGLSRGDLTEADGHNLNDLLPIERKSRSRGRPPEQSRSIINGILGRRRYGAPWRDLPSKYGRWNTIAGSGGGAKPGSGRSWR